MSGIETVAALSLVGAAAGGGLAASGASQQNRAVRRAQRQANTAATVQMQQVQQQAQLERQRRIQEAARLRGQLRVAAGELGAGPLGLSQLERQNDYDTSLDLTILGQNLANRIRAIRSGAQSTLDDMQNRTANPFTSGLQGGFSGLSTGLAFGSGLQDLGVIDRKSALFPTWLNGGQT